MDVLRREEFGSLAAKPMHEEWADQTAVYSYADYKKFTAEEITSFDPIGTWRGTFKAIENDEAAAMAAYGSFAGGYLRIISNDTEEHRKGRIGTFRAFYEPKNHKSFGATNGVIRYLPTLQGDIDDFEFQDFPAELFGSDMPTGINSPVFHVIEADGSHRYFDLQGRQLNGKPNTGIYINNGKKYSSK